MAASKTMMLIDTSKCIGCRACQVACKQWHSLPAEDTSFTGEYTNPPDLSRDTLTLVKFTEFVDWRGKLNFLMLKRQCMHCNNAKCQNRCPKGVEKTQEGFVVFNADCKPENVKLTAKELKAFKTANGRAPDPGIQEDYDYLKDLFLDVIRSCPYGIPRFDSDSGTFAKCDFCFNRFGNHYTTYRDGQPTTACELTCPPGAVVTGSDKVIKAQAKSRLYKVKKQYPKATLWGGRGRVIFLLTEKKASYGPWLTGL